MTVVDAVREELVVGLQRQHPELARAVAEPGTRLTPLEAPFLGRTRLYEARKFLPTRPLLVYAGLQAGGPTFLLNERPEAFDEMVRADGARVTDEAAATALVRMRQEVTRPQDHRYLIVDSLDAIPFRDGSAADESLRGVVQPPCATRAGDGFEVTLFVVEDEHLDRLIASVSPSGHVALMTHTVADALPLVYVL